MPGRTGSARAPAIAAGELPVLLDGYRMPEEGLVAVRPPPSGLVPAKVRVPTELPAERFGGELCRDACRVARKADSLPE